MGRSTPRLHRFRLMFFGLIFGLSIWGCAIQNTPVTNQEFRAQFFHHRSPKTRPAIIILGGSEGGIKWAAYTSELIARQGFVTLAVPYFYMSELPPQLEEIPFSDWQSRHAVAGHADGGHRGRTSAAAPFFFPGGAYCLRQCGARYCSGSRKSLDEMGWYGWRKWSSPT